MDVNAACTSRSRIVRSTTEPRTCPKGQEPPLGQARKGCQDVTASHTDSRASSRPTGDTTLTRPTWKFPSRNGGIDYVNDPSSAHFSDAPIAKLVRELIQNSPGR